MRHNTTKPNADQPESNHEMETDSDQEFETLNSQIDQLNSVLDVLEKKNDEIQAQLVELLKSSREARKSQNTQEKPSAS